MASNSIDIDPATFGRDLAAWDGNDPSFQDCVLSAMAQCLLYGSGSILMAALAGEFGVGLDGVRAWAFGTEIPDPATQRRVIASLRRHLAETVAVYLKFRDRLPVVSSGTVAVRASKALG